MRQSQYLTYEDDQFFLWLGNPRSANSTRINVTMAVQIGMRIGGGNLEGVELVEC